MRLNRAATVVHKWLALLMAVQIVLWTASGLFFAAVPIERVRSEHLLRDAPPPPVDLAVAAQGLARIDAASADKVEIRSVLGRPAALVAVGDARPVLYDLATGTRLSPIDSAAATAIASTAYHGPYAPVSTTLVTEASPEYRAALPAWRVDFSGGGHSFYVAVDTGAVTARRSTLWRVYDWLWALHIMDYDAHEDFNTPLLIAASALALVVALSGVVMLPSRLRSSKRKGRPAGR